MHKTRKAIDEQQMKMAEASAISSAEELRKEIVRLSQSYHNLGMCYVDFVEKCDELINQFKSDVEQKTINRICKKAGQCAIQPNSLQCPDDVICPH